MSQLSTFYPAPITAADLGLGPASNATFGSIQNTPIGNTTPAAATFTTLTAQGDGTNALVAEFGAADGINNEIHIWGNGAGRNHRIIGSTSGGIAFGLGTAQPTMVVNAGTPQGFRMFSAAALQWSSHGSNANAGTVDCTIFRDAADTVAQRRDTNPQTFRLYNTFTDASNYERGFMRWSSNVLQIGTEAAGTGTARTVEFPSTTNFTGQFRVGVGTGAATIRRGDGVTVATLVYNGVSSILSPTLLLGNDGTGGRVDINTDGADLLAIRRTTNAQAFRIYNTFTSATNFERLNVRWASNELIIDAEAGSAGGTLRGIKLGSATSSLLGFYGATPVDRPATVADPAGGGTVDTEARTAIGEVIDRLQELGLIA